MRAFVAIEVPPPGGGPPGAGRAPDHLTLRFLGEIAPDRTAPIGDRLAAVATRHPPFDLRIEGVGAFPSDAAPRVVWFGATVGREAATRLAEEVRAALRGEGDAPPEGPFVPHVTWFRVRSADDRRAALDAIAGRRPVPPPRSVRVEEFLLKESVLGRGGAVHRTLATFRLGGASGAGDPSASGPTSPPP